MDKYPELDESYAAGDVDGDFLKREKELLGDATDFAPAADGAASEAEQTEQSQTEHSETEQSQTEQSQFEQDYPPVKSESEATPSASQSQRQSPAPSQFIDEWKVKHQLEVERRDKVSQEKQEEIRAKAQTAIDDFYANYNTKREEAVKKVEEDATKFVAARDEQNTGSTWDKAASIIEGIGKPAEGVVAADKQRFRELVNSLKGDADAPGAAGY